jgi:hypothetical protein
MFSRVFSQAHRVQALHTRWITRSYQPPSSQVETDSLGIPVRPTWSVNELLASYPKPEITTSTMAHIHELSALIPPVVGTDAHAKLTSEMENLVKLVEAVKLVDTRTVDDSHPIPDGRIWAEGVGIELSEDVSEHPNDEVGGRALLQHASRTSPNGFYVVDTDRSK